ncbi:MAG: hypothetical protein WC438_02410 [Candidatus Pacearchaeota archaeon]
MIKGRIIFGLVVCIMISCFSLVYAGNIGIEAGNNYVPGEELHFKITLYGDNNQKINGQINYQILDYYSEVITEGIVESGVETIFKLPENTIQGHCAIVAKYNGREQRQLFNVGELERAEIKLEGDNLIITNVGNVVYNKKISISIGSHDETALVPLEIGQTKKIKLTAPAGNYDIKVSDGTDANTFEVEGVGLTGNVVGLESVVGDSFLNKFPLVGLFLGALLLVVVVIVGIKLMHKFAK